MADLVALSDLKAAFADFDSMVALIHEMRDKLVSITSFNQQAGGNDDYGTQYHQAVDQPTVNLLDLMKKVDEEVSLAGENGRLASDQYRNADESGTTLITG
jgi:hypothetical protein